MSFLSSMKKALGFSNELDDDELQEFSDDSGSTVGPIEPDTDLSQTVKENVPATGQESDHALPGDIFDSVIKLFNDIQPDFVSSCLNTDKQRQYILDNIDAAIKRRLEGAVDRAREQASRDASESQRKMTADIARLRELNSSLEAKKDEFQSAQLSASRQKRALNERVHDLETQVANLEAEKEQYQLENRSLVNKLRVASVRNGEDFDSEKIIQENIYLTNEVKSLRQKIEALEKEAHESAPQSEAALIEITKKLEQFEDVKQRLDSRIADLKSKLDNASEQSEKLAKELEDSQNENQSLRKTIENNLYLQAQNEAELKARIASLSTQTEQQTAPVAEATKNQPAPKSQKRKSKKRPVISAIDDLMESTDWFVAQEPTPMKTDSEDDFGYKEPVKKANSKDDDKQLSLF